MNIQNSRREYEQSQSPRDANLPESASRTTRKTASSGVSGRSRGGFDVFIVCLLALTVVFGVIGGAIYFENSASPSIPEVALTGATVVLVKDAPADLKVDVSVDGSRFFETDPVVRYKVSLNGPTSLVGNKYAVTLISLGSDKASPEVTQYVHENEESEQFETPVTQYLFANSVTSTAKEFFSDPSVNDAPADTSTVKSTAVRKMVEVVSADDVTGSGDPAAADTLWVETRPGKIGDHVAGRYRLVLPALGGNRGPFKITSHGKTRIVYPFGALKFESAFQKFAGAFPGSQRWSVDLGAAPAGIDVVQGSPALSNVVGPAISWNSGAFEDDQVDGSDPLRAQLVMSSSSEVGSCSVAVFLAGLLLALAASCMLLAVDRLVPDTLKKWRRRG